MGPWVRPFSHRTEGFQSRGMTGEHTREPLSLSLSPGKEKSCIFFCRELMFEGMVYQQGIGSHHSRALTTICLSLLDKKKMDEGGLDGL